MGKTTLRAALVLSVVSFLLEMGWEGWLGSGEPGQGLNDMELRGVGWVSVLLICSREVRTGCGLHVALRC